MGDADSTTGRFWDSSALGDDWLSSNDLTVLEAELDRNSARATDADRRTPETAVSSREKMNRRSDALMSMKATWLFASWTGQLLRGYESEFKASQPCQRLCRTS